MDSAINIKPNAVVLMATTSKPLITATPGVKGGSACIAGHGLPVKRIAVFYNQGHSAETIASEHYDHLSLAQVYAALTYYFINKQEIDEEIEFDDQEHDRLARLQRELGADWIKHI